MKLKSALVGAFLVLLCIGHFVGADGPDADRPTIVFVVRHAEKDESNSNPSDPPLSATGQVRAKHLAHMLKDAGVAAIYVTPFMRSRQTAEPLAVQAHVTPTPVAAAEIGAVVADIQSHHAGDAVLVVAHSNTVPEIIAKLSGRTVPVIPEKEFDNFYVITKRGSDASVVHLRYGSES